MTNHTNNSFIIDTPEGIHLVRLLSARSALKLEISTGMKLSRGMSALKATNHVLGTNFRRKQDALDALNEILASFDAARAAEV